MNTNKTDVDIIKQNIDLRQLAGKFTTLEGKGSSQAGPCPKCKGADRFVVYADRFLCRHCHPAYGDSIEFARWLNDFDFRQAVDWLTNGNTPMLESDKPKAAAAQEVKDVQPPPAEWQERGRAFVKYAQEQLWGPAGAAGMAYLKSRGLEPQTISKAGLGFNPKDVWDKPESWGLEEGRKVWLPAGIVFPWEIKGGLWRVNIRLLEPRTVNGRTLKYIGPRGNEGSNPLYNADNAIARKCVVIVEGEIDCLTLLQEAGDLCTPVATGSKDGAQAARWIARLSASELVLLAQDAEVGKGDEAAAKWGKHLWANSKRWRPLLKDVNAMHTAGISVRNWIAGALVFNPIEPPPFKVVTWPADVALPSVPI